MPIFDGKTLNGWDGDTTFWRVENGEIVGETTPEKVVKLNNFLIWRGGTVKDFELKVEFRMSGTNSGIQYRSVELPERRQVGAEGLSGRHGLHRRLSSATCTTSAAARRPAKARRALAARPGHAHRRRAEVQGRRRRSATARCCAASMNVNGWNQYHIIARGPVLMQFINGQLMAVAIDEDTQALRRPKGCSASRCTSGRRSKSNTGISCTRSWGSDRRSGRECTMAQIGVNAWVWSSPITTEELGRLAPMIARHGLRPGRGPHREHDRSRLPQAAPRSRTRTGWR